jgi:hypothetical protein
LKAERSAWVLLLMAGLVPASYAGDTPASSTPPEAAKSGAPPAKTTAPKSAAPAQPAATPAAKPAATPEADEELLEFLGSVDADAGDQDWIDYLSQTDIAKVAKGRKDD